MYYLLILPLDVKRHFILPLFTYSHNFLRSYTKQKRKKNKDFSIKAHWHTFALKLFVGTFSRCSGTFNSSSPLSSIGFMFLKTYQMMQH